MKKQTSTAETQYQKLDKIHGNAKRDSKTNSTLVMKSFMSFLKTKYIKALISFLNINEFKKVKLRKYEKKETKAFVNKTFSNKKLSVSDYKQFL